MSNELLIENILKDIEETCRKIQSGLNSLEEDWSVYQGYPDGIEKVRIRNLLIQSATLLKQVDEKLEQVVKR